MKNELPTPKLYYLPYIRILPDIQHEESKGHHGHHYLDLSRIEQNLQSYSLQLKTRTDSSQGLSQDSGINNYNYTLCWGYCNIKKRENSGSTRPHIIKIKHHGCHPIISLLFFCLVDGVEVVHVGLVVTSDAIGDNLQGLRIAAIKTHNSAGQVAEVSHGRVE